MNLTPIDEMILEIPMWLRLIPALALGSLLALSMGLEWWRSVR